MQIRPMYTGGYDRPSLTYTDSDWTSRPSGSVSPLQPVGGGTVPTEPAPQFAPIPPATAPAPAPQPGVGTVTPTTYTAGGAQPGGTTGAPTATQAPTTRPPAPNMTFAQLQAMGIARPPAPVAPTAGPQYQPSQQFAQLSGPLLQSVMAMLASPSGYTDANVQGAIDRNRSRLDQQFNTNSRRLDEMMARRGIYDSTIAGANYGDLVAERERQDSEFTGNLLDNYARQLQSDRASALGQAMGLGNLLGDQNARDFQLSRAGTQQDYENQLAFNRSLQDIYGRDIDFALADQRLYYDALAQMLGLVNSTELGDLAGQNPTTTQFPGGPTLDRTTGEVTGFESPTQRILRGLGYA